MMIYVKLNDGKHLVAMQQPLKNIVNRSTIVAGKNRDKHYYIGHMTPEIFK
jgi:hypothetical protein